jgi:3-hydroxybutyryl-CoA dehydrogenase
MNASLIVPAEIAQVGVIGGGQMGNGIAHVCALAGLPVILLDVKAEALTKAMATMARNMERQVNRSIISAGRSRRGAGAHQDLDRLRRRSATPTW